MRSRILLFFAAVFLLWNLFCFIAMGVDKRRAVKKRQRISERQLILCALFFGALGSCAGMYAFRHKTKKRPFPWLFPLLCAVQLVGAVYVILLYLKQAV